MKSVSFTLLATITFWTIAAAQPTLDASWTVTVAGRAVQVNPDGSFLIPNISLADRFGEFGQGFSGPNCLSDDFVRLTGFRPGPAGNQYVVSEYFQARCNTTYQVQNLVFSTTPPRSVASLTRTVTNAILTPQNNTSQITVTAHYSDGSSGNVTPRSAFTTYRSSNTGIARVNHNGLIVGTGFGQVYITATNDGVSTVIGLQVGVADPGTTLVGFVHDLAGVPVSGTQVVLPSIGLTGTSDATGRFLIPGCPTQQGAVLLQAQTQIAGINYIANGVVTAFVPQQFTDAGVLVLRPIRPILVVWDPADPFNYSNAARLAVQSAAAAVLGGVQTQFATSVPSTIGTAVAGVFDLRYRAALSSSETAIYASYLQSGGRLVLSGETQLSQARNDSVVSLIQSQGGGAVGISGLGPFNLNTQACVDPAFCTTPNVVVNASFLATGVIQPIGLGTRVTSQSIVLWREGQLAIAPNGVAIVVADINFWAQIQNTLLIRNFIQSFEGL